MAAAFEPFQLWLPENKKGVTICKRRYDQLVLTIITTLQNSPEETASLVRLLEKATAQFGEESNVGWELLQVKLDLQARGVIVISINREKEQHVRLNLSTLRKKKRRV